ncbi:MAG: HAMP domain-containing protein [Deltaproteobacteria bacterium]|nr:MAG: HAMP domain-containing protein [Deltaproteobacteria bacterium]
MRLSISTRIFLGLAIIVVTFGAVSIYAVLHLNGIGRRLEVVGQLLMPLTKVVTQLETVQQNRARDTARLVEEEDIRLRAALIRIARRHYPKIIRQNLAKGRDLVRAGRSKTTDPETLAFLDDVDARFRRLERHFDRYIETASTLYGRLEQGARTEEVAELSRQLEQRERRLGSQIRALSRALELRLQREVFEAQAEEDRATLAIMLLSLSAVLVALLVTLFTQRTLRPIRLLTEGVQDISRGEFGRRVEISSSDEIGDLGREFNAMAQALEERERQLAEQRRALLRAERLAAVGRMAAQVSHEIRNPLSSIGLNAELLGDELGDRPEAHRLLDAIATEIDRLTEITEAYLDFARLPQPSLSEEDIGALVRDLAEFTRSEMEAGGITLHTEIAGDLPRVRIDPNQLRRGLYNLLRNAREAMPGGGEIWLRVRAAGDRLRMEVEDTGPGIDEADQEHIFDPFFSTKEGGTGLGLSLTAQIVEEHGGRIRCEHGARGARFVVELPLEPADGDEHRPTASE